MIYDRPLSITFDMLFQFLEGANHIGIIIVRIYKTGIVLLFLIYNVSIVTICGMVIFIENHIKAEIRIVTNARFICQKLINYKTRIFIEFQILVKNILSQCIVSAKVNKFGALKKIELNENIGFWRK